uniref:Uncharacterized protein n=1 Tax=candidate division WOR-3 bacterium TaxID=2052148 RepID=A0A7C4CDA4_UNCW3
MGSKFACRKWQQRSPAKARSSRNEGGEVGLFAFDDAGELVDLFSNDVAQFKRCLPRRVVEAFAQSAKKFVEKDFAAGVVEIDADRF